MNRISINFNPSPDAVLDAIDFANANLNTLFQQGRAGDQDALRLYGARKDYLDGRDNGGIWIAHFHAVYIASRTVQS